MANKQDQSRIGAAGGAAIGCFIGARILPVVGGIIGAAVGAFAGYAVGDSARTQKRDIVFTINPSGKTDPGGDETVQKISEAEHYKICSKCKTANDESCLLCEFCGEPL